MKRTHLLLLYSHLIKGVRGLFLSTLCCLLFTVFLWGCGAGGGSAPPGSTITINPSSMSVTDDSTTARWFTVFFTITVKDSNGNPINDAKISILYPWAVPNLDVVRLYDGSTAKNSPFDAYTDEFGVYTLRFDYQSGGGLEYTGDLEVRSGDVYATASVDVSG